MKSLPGRWYPILPWLLMSALLFCDPVFANKFETIGGGVQGSTQAKVEYLRFVAYGTSGIFLVAGILSIALHDKNAQTLNYTMWKSSAILFFLLSAAILAMAVFMN